jgi:hypothetical protein
MMGQHATPAMLADGSVHARGKQSATDNARWEQLERAVHGEKQQVAQKVLAGLKAGESAENLVELLDSWAATQAARLFDAL